MDLSEQARSALSRARAEKLSYAVRVLRARDDRLVVVLGEIHLKLEKASRIGKELVESFELRGVETFQRKQVFCGRVLGVLIHAPRALLRALSFGAVKDSTITDAKQLASGYTVELERAKAMPFGLHVASLYLTAFFLVAIAAGLAPLLPIPPDLWAAITLVAIAFELHMILLLPAILLRRHPFCWVIHPFLGILTLRDELMAAGTVTMLEDHKTPKAAIVVMGRAHVSGYERILVERYGFTRAEPLA